MKILGEEQEKAAIEYPCEWIYKVIGEDCSLMNNVIEQACSNLSPQISHSQSSSKGKYHSLRVKLIVESEEMRLNIYTQLKNSPAVKVVL